MEDGNKKSPGRRLLRLLMFPFSWPHDKLDALILFSSTILCTIAIPFAATAAPTAKEYMEDNGMDPKVVDELSPDKKIHIVTGFPNTLINGSRVLWGISGPSLVYLTLEGLSDATGTAQNGNALSPRNLFNWTDSCIITLDNWNRPGILAKEIANAGEMSRKDVRKDIPVSEADIARYIALHEIRHCNQDAASMSSAEREADSDYYAMNIAARELNNPEIIRWGFNWRAVKMPSGEEHDMTLLLDAKMRNQPLPSNDERKAANKEAREFIKDGKPSDIGKLSPLAQKRVKMYNDAQNYFKKAPPAPKTSAPVISSMTLS